VNQFTLDQNKGGGGSSRSKCKNQTACAASEAVRIRYLKNYGGRLWPKRCAGRARQFLIKTGRPARMDHGVVISEKDGYR
jgi:hypothetical protein